MKRLVQLFTFILIMLPLVVFGAADVTFQWDLNPESEGVHKYFLYQSSTSGVYTYGRGNQIEIRNHPIDTVTVQVEDGTWWFVLTAVKNVDGVEYESGPSNEVSLILPPPVVITPPSPPTGLRSTTVIIININ